MSDCNRCLWATRNGSCASWDCRFVDQREAYEAYNREKADANKWIPVSERLPCDGIPVNITWVNRKPVSYYVDIKDKHFTATGIYYRGKWFWYSWACEDLLYEYGNSKADAVDEDVEIIAWMPLPECYRGDENVK